MRLACIGSLAVDKAACAIAKVTVQIPHPTSAEPPSVSAPIEY
ncbi:hypothetical protein [Polaromonas sp. CG9_12]|nr:hypothetical protein [Polaromonas sp. CG9_12]